MITQNYAVICCETEHTSVYCIQKYNVIKIGLLKVQAKEDVSELVKAGA